MTTAVRFSSTLCHVYFEGAASGGHHFRSLVRIAFFFGVPVLLRQVGKQHLTHECRALAFTDHQNPVDDQRTVDFLIHQFEVKLVGKWQTQQVGDRCPVEGCQQCNRHERSELGWVGHIGKHLHHADQGADHAEGRRAIADRAIDFLPLVQMREKIVPVAFEVVADEVAIVAVGDETDTFGEERILDLDLFETNRSRLPRNFGKAGQFIDQIALTHAAQRESEFCPKRQAMEDRRKRKTDQSSCESAAEDHDGGMRIEEHPQIAAHENERGKDHYPRQQA